jgi:2-hydroxy-3-oxopropionate reductase
VDIEKGGNGDMAGEIKRIGFIGTGLMGAPMARNLARAGFLVTAFDQDATKVERLGPHGVKPCGSGAAAATDKDAVVVMLNTGPVCDDVLLREGTGALWAMRPGSLLIVMSSIAVKTAKEQARRAGEVGVRYLDAPVSGGEVGAKDGTLSIMVGGKEADVATARSVFDALGRPVHIGPIGTGQLTKLANQLTVASTIVAVAETLLLAERGGADLARVREALLGGFAKSRILELQGLRMIEEDFKPGGTATHQIKDTAAALELAEDLGIRLPMLELADRLFTDLVANGDGELDHSAIIRELRRRNALPVT